MYLTDYHCHSILSPDGKVPLSVLAEHALSAGLSEFCLTDHCDLLGFDAKRCYSYDWPAALEQYRRTVPQFAERLTIRLGLEFGMGHIDPPAADAILDQPELDFVIGSVHNLSPEAGGTDLFYVDYSTRENCAKALDDYFSSLEQLAESDYYDVIGHIIYPFRYMNGMAVVDPYLDRITDLLRTVVRRGKGIEVNTYRGNTVADWAPVLERYKAVGGELVTVGSDAHDPAYMGGGIAEAYALLERMGFRYVAVFDKRKPRMITI